MKKMLMFAALFCSVVALAQEPVITFNETTHDFGKINEADGKVTTIFEFINEGMTPLVLTNVRASCGCTTPKWTHEPIEPGQKGQITVTYNPSGRPGRFQKTVTVTSNATVPTTKLYIKGEVIPKPAKPADEYSIKMGELSLKKQSINFSNVTKGANKAMAISYANTTDAPISVDIVADHMDFYFKPLVTRPELQPGETGIIQVALQSDECPIYGPIDATMYVVVNGKKVLSDEYAISIKANIKEDFSKMSVEERQQAPIAEVTRELNLGTIAKGKKLTTKLTLANAGINPLLVRRVIMNDQQLKFTTPKAIKAGRKADIKIELDATTYEPAQYSRIMTLITNDPNTPVINIKLNWVVE